MHVFFKISSFLKSEMSSTHCFLRSCKSEFFNASVTFVIARTGNFMMYALLAETMSGCGLYPGQDSTYLVKKYNI